MSIKTQDLGPYFDGAAVEKAARQAHESATDQRHNERQMSRRQIDVAVASRAWPDIYPANFTPISSIDDAIESAKRFFGARRWHITVKESGGFTVVDPDGSPSEDRELARAICYAILRAPAPEARHE